MSSTIQGRFSVLRKKNRNAESCWATLMASSLRSAGVYAGQAGNPIALSSEGGRTKEGSMPTTAFAPARAIPITANKLLINYQWTEAASGRTFATINLSTGEEICQVEAACATLAGNH